MRRFSFLVESGFFIVSASGGRLKHEPPLAPILSCAGACHHPSRGDRWRDHRIDRDLDSTQIFGLRRHKLPRCFLRCRQTIWLRQRIGTHTALAVRAYAFVPVARRERPHGVIRDVSQIPLSLWDFLLLWVLCSPTQPGLRWLWECTTGQ